MRQSKPITYHGPRYQLRLGKGIVEDTKPGATGLKMLLNFGFIKVWVDCPVQGDVRVGDGLELYTEIPIGKRQ